MEQDAAAGDQDQDDDRHGRDRAQALAADGLLPVFRSVGPAGGPRTCGEGRAGNRVPTGVRRMKFFDLVIPAGRRRVWCL
jgi:hypothetical protein